MISRNKSVPSAYSLSAEQLADLMRASEEEQREALDSLGGVAGIAEALRVSLEEGIPAQELKTGCVARLQSFGNNALPDPPSKSFLELLWEAYTDATIIILSIAAVISLVFGILFPPEGEEDTAWIEGAAILMAVVLVTLVGAGNNYSKEQQFKELNKQKENKPVEVVRGGKETEISSNDLMVGDIILLKQGERVPADCLYVDGRGTAECIIDPSVMTGEPSATVNKEQPFLLSGCIIDEGLAKGLVIAVGEESQYGILFSRLQADNPETPLEERLERLANWIGYGGLSAAILLFAVLLGFFLFDHYTGTHTRPYCIYPWDGTNNALSVCWDKVVDPTWGADAAHEITHIAIMSITIVVVAVPEGLPLAVTLSLAYSMRQMMQDNCLVRRLAACETMGGATTICSDKTGTLTENRMTVVAGCIGEKEFNTLPPNFRVGDKPLRLLCDGIAINSKANVVPPATNEIGALPQFLGNKTECGLLVYAAAVEQGFDYHEVRKQGEGAEVTMFNFTAERKRMSTIIKVDPEEAGYPFRMYTKGASEIILKRSTHMMTCDGEIREITSEDYKRFSVLIKRMADEGLRTIGIAYRHFEDESDFRPAVRDEKDKWEPPEYGLILLSIVGLKDPIRKEVPDAVLTCQRAGIVVRMVTGDNIDTAKKIAKDCGLYTEGGLALEGPDFRKMSDAEVDKILPRLQVLARSIPSDKQRLVERLQANREVVAATGDGSNDGPALKAAHVGLSMGLSGTDVAIQASDIVILDDNFKSIVLAVMWGRCVYDNIKKFLQFQLTVNVAAISVALISAVTDRGTPLAAIQLLWVNLIMDTFAALALGTEKPTPELLNRKPYGLDEKVPISRYMWRAIIGQSIYQVGILLFMIFEGAPLLGLEDKGEEHYTLVFNTFVWMQLFNEINSRKVNNEINVFENIFSNWLFSAIFIITAVTQIIIVEFAGEIMKTTHQNLREWGIALGLGLLAIPLGFLLHFVPVGNVEYTAPLQLSTAEDTAEMEPLPIRKSGGGGGGGSTVGTSGGGRSQQRPEKEREKEVHNGDHFDELDLDAPGDSDPLMPNKKREEV